jgi:DNA-binding beta-propeller fold protein YncE
MEKQPKDPTDKAQPTESKKRMPARWVGIFAVILGLIALLIILLVILPDALDSSATGLVAVRQEESTLILYKGEIIDTIEKAIPAQVLVSEKKDALALLTDEGALYYMTTHSTKLLEERDATLGRIGQSVLYYVQSGSLYCYEAKKSSSTLIPSTDVSEVTALSPNGKSVLFTQGTGENATVWLSVSGKVSQVDDAIRGIALSDKGKYLYIQEPNGSTYVRTAKTESKLIPSDAKQIRFFFTSKEDQVLFSYVSSTGDSKTYLSVKGGDKELFLSTAISRLISPGRQESVSTDDSIYIGPLVAAFKNTYFLALDGLYHCDTEAVPTLLSSGITEAALSKNGKVLVYGDAELKLWKVIGTSAPTESRPLLFTSPVSQYRLTDKGNYLFFLTQDGSLYCSTKLGAQEALLSSDIDKIALQPSKNALYFTESGGTGKLKWSVNGGKVKELTNPSNAYSLEEISGGVICFSNYESEIATMYIFSGSGKSKRLAYDVSPVLP